MGIEKEEANGEIFNVGTGVATDVLSVANSLIEAYGIEVPVHISSRFRLGDIRHNFADMSKIKQYLDFEPKVFFKKGIANFTEWVLAQKIEKDTLNKSLEEMKAKGLLK
jgi:dTDP-L-rhamnose 4-epimerase